MSCSLLLALAIVAVAAAPDSQANKTVPRSVGGAMDGRFTFTGPLLGPWETTGDVKGTLRHLGLAKMYTRHIASPDGTLSDGIFPMWPLTATKSGARTRPLESGSRALKSLERRLS